VQTTSLAPLPRAAAAWSVRPTWLAERLAEILQVLARAEPMLGCDRQLVVPLATEAGLRDALNACLLPTLEPLASWTRTGKVELPDGDVRRQHWWSSRVTQVKGAALPQAATGLDIHGWGHSGRARRADGCRPPPQWRARGSAPLLQVTQVVPGAALTTSVLRGQTVPPMWRAGGRRRRRRRVM